MLLDRVREEALSRLAGATIEGACAARVAAVLLGDGRLGVSSMLSAAGGADAAARLRGTPAAEAAARLSREGSQLERSLALAAVNAAASPLEASCDAGALPLPGPRDVVTVIGYIGRLVEAVSSRAGRLFVFDDGRSEGVMPRRRQRECLGASDVVYVTGSAFANATIDDVVQAAVRARMVAVVGPSTPLHPRAFSGSAVTMLAGACFKDADAVLRLCEAGAGMRDLGAHMIKVWLQVPR